MSISAESGLPVARAGLADSWRAMRPWVLGALSVAAVAAFWQACYSFEWVNRLFLPSPAQVGEALLATLADDGFLEDLGVSAYEFGWGLGLSVLVGGTLGILAGWYRPVEEFLQPIVIALNSTPTLAIIPLLILVFGIGVLPKIILVMLACTVIMLLNTAAGVRSVDAQHMRMARSFKASDWQIIRTVVIPSVVPYFMTGLRISVGTAVVAVAVAEIFGSHSGLGNRLIVAQTSFNMPVMYASVIILTVIGIALTQGAAMVERYFLRWRG